MIKYMRSFGFVMVEYDQFVFNRKSISMIHTTILQLMDQSILIDNVGHDAKMATHWNIAFMFCLIFCKFIRTMTD
jgi:hypothetical protein